MEVLTFREFKKNTLQGFIEVKLGSGMCIRDLTLHEKNGNKWVGYPSKPFKADDGSTKWQNQIFFEDKEIHQNFQRQILKALDAHLSPPNADDNIPF